MYLNNFKTIKKKVSLKLNEADQQTIGGPTVFKPCVGFLLRPSLGSAFQPIGSAGKPFVDTIKDGSNEPTQ